VSAPLIGGAITIPAIATDILTLLAQAGAQMPTYATVGNWTIRADDGNAGKIWLGNDSTLTVTSANRLGYLKAGEALALALLVIRFHLDQVFLVGTPGDRAYMIAVEF